MIKRTKALVVGIAFAIFGFLIQPHAPLGALIWPPSSDIPAVVGMQEPLLMVYGAIAALAFGAGVAFLAFGRPLVEKLGLSKGLTTGAHLSIAWVLLNWVIHDSLHIANGHNIWGLIAIEYAFHGTLILAGATLVYALLRVQPREARPAA